MILVHDMWICTLLLPLSEPRIRSEQVPEVTTGFTTDLKANFQEKHPSLTAEDHKLLRALALEHRHRRLRY